MLLTGGIMKQAPRVLEAPGRPDHNRDGDAIMATGRIARKGEKSKRICLEGELNETRKRRFWAKVLKMPECWIWTGDTTTKGYGRVTWQTDGRRMQIAAHRVSFFMAHGRVGDVLDHRCRDKRCVNPDHLEEVTDRENILRGDSPSAHHARKTHCIRGHEFHPVKKASGARQCKTCEAEREKRRPLRDQSHRWGKK